MTKALKGLLSRENEDSFVIFSDQQTKRFVQFAGSEHENLLLDLPIQSLSTQEIEQVQRIANDSFDLKVVTTSFGLNIDLGKDYKIAVKIALDIMHQVFELSRDFELEVEEN